MTPKIENIRFYYLTCNSQDNRQNSIEEQWKTVSDTVPLNRFNGTHYYDFGIDYLMECLNVTDTSRVAKHPPSLAVIKSHLALWKRIIDRRIPYTFIFEDDVKIPENFFETLNNILQEGLPKKWDMLYFGILKLYGKKQNPESKWIKIIKKTFHNNGFHGYLLSLKGARKLYKFYNLKTFEEQIDIFFRNYSDELNLYAYEENIIKQNFADFESIRLGRFVKTEIQKEFDDKIIFDNDNNIIVNTRIDRLQREEEARQTDTTIVTTQNGTENDKTKNVETDSDADADADTENSTTIDLNIIKEKLEEAKIEEECQASAS
jgi:GR25 family glycosyltransferase involved in LPS biosynthesis